MDGEIKQISLEDYKGKWTVVFFYPKDFTYVPRLAVTFVLSGVSIERMLISINMLHFTYSYVCPTEIIAFSDAAKRFEEIGAKVIGT